MNAMTSAAAQPPGPARPIPPPGSWPGLPGDRPLGGADLDAMPDDGYRYELVDGLLIVTPPPAFGHQSVAVDLFRLLDAALPSSDFRAVFAPVRVSVDDRTHLEPDLLVVRRDRTSWRSLHGLPLLAVEILSPSTRHYDLTMKRSRYEEAGIASYWVVDPYEPGVIAWDLRDGRYTEVAHARGDEPFRAVHPYPVTLVPADLVASLSPPA